MGFEASWLAARGPYDERALDRDAVRQLRAWGAALGPVRAPLVVVDLGSGTGAALRRAARWLAPRPVVGYAVERDAALLRRAVATASAHATGAADAAADGTAGAGTYADGGTSTVEQPGAALRIVPVAGDLLRPLADAGGPPDGTVDLVLSHALADLVPLDRFAARVAALLRPGGLTHVALVYDGLTVFAPATDRALDRAVLAAFHRQMDRPAAEQPAHGGSTAGRRVGMALAEAGLEVVRDAPSVWRVAAGDGPAGRMVLDRLIRYVVEAAAADGAVAPADLARWEADRRAALASSTLRARVAHRDVLARALRSRSASPASRPGRARSGVGAPGPAGRRLPGS